VNDVRESYDAWRNASSGVQRAYDRWATSGATDRDVGFGGYLAALQQEEHAAQVYQGRLERARRRTRGGIGQGGWRKALA
jgi:hypothetical protein